MALPKQLPDVEELCRLLDYDPNTGVLTWKYRPEASPQWNGKNAGRPAGAPSKSTGRLVFNIGRRLFLCHRVIWKMVHGTDPVADLDHKDGDPTNNRINNLRPASHHQNLRNAKLHRGKSLPKGVSIYQVDRYRASIYVGGRCRHLGCFDDPNSAHVAYRRAASLHFGEFARFE